MNAQRDAWFETWVRIFQVMIRLRRRTRGASPTPTGR